MKSKVYAEIKQNKNIMNLQNITQGQCIFHCKISQYQI